MRKEQDLEKKEDHLTPSIGLMHWMTQIQALTNEELQILLRQLQAKIDVVLKESRKRAYGK